MKTEDIIRLAREAGLPYIYQTGEVANLGLVERFAGLVAAHEREACAYKAGIALLGADRGLANRVDQAIRSRSNG